MEEFEIQNKVLVKYNGTAKEVTIPAGVEEIGQSAFRESKAKHIILPPSVKEIDTSAFEYSHIESISLNEGLVSIAELAFRGCVALSNVSVPSSVKWIGDWAFGSCRSLESVHLPEGLERIGENCFQLCRSLKHINIPESIVQCPKSAFIGCTELKEEKSDFIVIDNLLVDYAGKEEKVIIPQNIAIIGESAFEGKRIKEVILPRGLKTIGYRAFANCTSLEQIECPEGLKTIRFNAFANCNLLDQVVLPEGLESIEGGTFSGCKSLKSIIIPASVTKLGKKAFENCESLEQIVLQEGLERIGDYVFYNCKSLQDINIPKSIIACSKSAFTGCKNLRGKNGFLISNTYLISYSGKASDVIVPDYVEIIGEEAFANHKNLQSIIIPASIKKIVGQLAFKGCSSLRTVTFEEKAPKNCDKSFHNCPIEIIYAPASSVSDFSVFKEAYLIGFVLLLKKGISIKDEIVKQNNKYIKQNVRKLYATKSEDLFEYILRNKLIPLEDIDELVTKFNKEKNVARVAALIDYKEKNFTEKQRERQFNKQFELREPTLAELKKIWTFAKKEDGTYRISAYNGEEVDIVIPSMLKGVNVTEVGNGRACFFSEQLREKVMNVTLPEGIATIGTKAFNDCKSLKSITIPSSVTVMGCRIFDGCHGITVYCRCQALPAGWDKDWDRIGWGGRVNVVWGYKGD